MKRNRNTHEYSMSQIPTSLIKNFEFENKLRRFLTDAPSKQKLSTHGYHYKQNTKFKVKDHPRWDGSTNTPKFIKPSEPIFASDFLSTLYNEDGSINYIT